MGLIGQALHHWPTTSPGLSGVPLHYEWFVFFHMAAVTQVTHVAIPTVALRLDYVPTMVVIGCELLRGRTIARSVRVGWGPRDRRPCSCSARWISRRTPRACLRPSTNDSNPISGQAGPSRSG